MVLPLVEVALLQGARRALSCRKMAAAVRIGKCEKGSSCHDRRHPRLNQQLPAAPCTGTQRCKNGLASSNFISAPASLLDRKSTRLNSSHVSISYAVFCLKKKKLN